MKWRPYILAVLIAVFISFNCFAAPNFSPDFLASTTQASFQTCTCRAIDYNITVVNTGAFSASFGVSQEGVLAKYALVSPEAFVLSPGQQQNVQVIVRVPCNFRGGNYPLKTLIYNDLNVQKGFTQDFDVKACSNINFNLTFSTPEGCRCDVFDYSILLSNPGVYDEVYHFKINGANATFSENDVTIGAGKERFITVSVAPECSWGSRDVRLDVSTKYTKQRRSFDLPLKVNTNCASQEYRPSLLDYSMWIIAGLCVLIALVIALIIFVIIRRRHGPRRKPKLVGLKLDKEYVVLKRHFPWKRVLVVLVILALIGAGGFFAYKYIPPMFEGSEQFSIAPRNGGGGMFHIVPSAPENVTNESVEGTENNGTLVAAASREFVLWDYWIYLVIGFAVLLVAIIVLHNANGYRAARPVVLAKRIATLLLILFILGIAGYAVYWTLSKWGSEIWSAVWGFLQIYYVYLIIGFVLLAALIVFFALNNRRKVYSVEKTVELVCEYCGKGFKTELGLDKHRKAKH